MKPAPSDEQTQPSVDTPAPAPPPEGTSDFSDELQSGLLAVILEEF